MSVARITEIFQPRQEELRRRHHAGRRARQLKNVKGVWIKDQEVLVDKGKISGYKVAMKVTFVLAD